MTSKLLLYGVRRNISTEQFDLDRFKYVFSTALLSVEYAFDLKQYSSLDISKCFEEAIAQMPQFFHVLVLILDQYAGMHQQLISLITKILDLLKYCTTRISMTYDKDLSPKDIQILTKNLHNYGKSLFLDPDFRLIEIKQGSTIIDCNVNLWRFLCAGTDWSKIPGLDGVKPALLGASEFTIKSEARNLIELKLTQLVKSPRIITTDSVGRIIKVVKSQLVDKFSFDSSSYKLWRQLSLDPYQFENLFTELGSVSDESGYWLEQVVEQKFSQEPSITLQMLIRFGFSYKSATKLQELFSTDKHYSDYHILAYWLRENIRSCADNDELPETSLTELSSSVPQDEIYYPNESSSLPGHLSYWRSSGADIPTMLIKKITTQLGLSEDDCYYHGTSLDRAQIICSEDSWLDSDCFSKNGDLGSGFYLSDSFASAAYFAIRKCIIHANLPVVLVYRFKAPAWKIVNTMGVCENFDGQPRLICKHLADDDENWSKVINSGWNPQYKTALKKFSRVHSTSKKRGNKNNVRVADILGSAISVRVNNLRQPSSTHQLCFKTEPARELAWNSMVSVILLPIDYEVPELV